MRLCETIFFCMRQFDLKIGVNQSGGFLINMKKLLPISFLLLATTLAAQNPVSKFINNDLLRNANISLSITDLNSGKAVYEHRSHHSATPASTMKVITTATALELLGSDFRFATELLIDGIITADGQLNGNLHIRGTGDPTLGSKHMGNLDFLNEWANTLIRAGIKSIDGKILPDADFFDTEGINPYWIWEDMGNYYAPSIYGISYLDNTYELVFQSEAVGSTPKIIDMIPSIPNLVFDNHLKSTAIKRDSAYIYGAPRSRFRSIYGAIPTNQSRFTVKGDIPSPDSLLAAHFTEKLQEKGIKIAGNSRTVNGKKNIIHTHFSPPLHEIITQINVRSNNHYAEQLFRYLGANDKGIATSTMAAQRIKSFWQQKGLSCKQLFMKDGCGLSPVNAVSANFFVELLTYMQTKSKNADIFKASLPTAGINGTVAGLLKNTPLQGKVRAKSGSIAHVRAYTGYIDKDGKKYAFAVLVNNANGSSSQVVKKIEELLLAVE